MLDVSSQALWSEVEASEAVVESHLSKFKDKLERYYGGDWKSSAPDNQETPENHYFEWIALMVPRMVSGNPRTRVGTRRPGSQEKIAEAVQFGLNRWSRDTNMKRLLEKLAVDFSFNWAVALTTVETRPGQKEREDPDQWPSVIRIPQERFGWDSVATSIEEARFQYHMVIRDRDDIEEEGKDKKSGWNLEAMDSLAKDAGTETLHRDRERVVERNEVVYYEIWVPEIELDESDGPAKGFHGTIYTLGIGNAGSDDRKAEFIRDPRPYFGPRWGPYTLIGAYTVPNEVAPLSPLVAVEGQITDVNAHARAISEAAARYKKLAFVDATAKELADAISSAEDGSLVPIPGLEKSKFVESEVGGPSPVMVQYLEYLRDRLDRNAGMGEAQRGSVEGAGTTATEQSIASEASTIRISFPLQKFEDGVQRIFKTVAWFLFNMEEIKFPLGPEVAEEMNMGPQIVAGPDGMPMQVPAEPWFQGGHTDEEESGASFDDMELEIESHSLRRTSDAQDQQRAAFLLELSLNYAPGIPMAPWVDHRRVIREAGEARGFTGLDDYFIWEAVPNIPPEMLLDPAQARFSVDSGSAGVHGRGNATGNQTTPQIKPMKTGLEGNTSGAVAGAGGTPT